MQKKAEISIEPDPVLKVEPLDVPLINQMDPPRLYNGCEVSSLAMVLNYHDYEVTKNELADQTKVVPLTYENGLKGNPNEGFVGNMANGPGLSVYNGPIFEVAQEYVGNRAINLTGSTIDEVYDYVAQGLPVWVITTSNLVPVSDFETWDTPKGEIDVTYSVHSVVVTGYDEESVYVNNPYGFKNQQVDRSYFEEAWEQMGSQAIVITDE
ncbi:C39 family peptidase [Oceanobacillus halotolerans]|uniref:C39 family peptidase n=1 Tax=Oceanobacillus halotolerans TaxID=2663380 RepID=UPI001CF7B226|nr:C39 family peptidase [Oceanobacillus halotolerans]